MKLFFKRLKLTFMPALVAGIILFFGVCPRPRENGYSESNGAVAVFAADCEAENCISFGRLPYGVTVNGVDLGGKKRGEAVSLLRRREEDFLKHKRLRICADERVFCYDFPEFYYSENFAEQLEKIERKGDYTLPVKYYLNGAEEVVEIICSQTEREVVEPYAIFNKSGSPFTYYGGRDGKSCDKAALLRDIDASLNGGFFDVCAKYEAVKRKLSVEDIKKQTSLLNSFTTYFDGTNHARSANIRLAASKINGCRLMPGQTFSFNAAVGERSVENGFTFAKIISGGRFVDGVGGGVCQVSTTLYNAALLSGLRIDEYHPHSLAVSYVAPSRDAMVSGKYFDLKFTNTALTPIYIAMNCTLNSVCCKIYGLDGGAKFSILSEVIGKLPQPPDEVIEGDEDRIISAGREGTVSLGFLVEERNGVKIKKLLRKDKYGATRTVRSVKRDDGDARGDDTAQNVPAPNNA